MNLLLLLKSPRESRSFHSHSYFHPYKWFQLNIALEIHKSTAIMIKIRNAISFPTLTSVCMIMKSQSTDKFILI